MSDSLPAPNVWRRQVVLPSTNPTCPHHRIPRLSAVASAAVPASDAANAPGLNLQSLGRRLLRANHHGGWGGRASYPWGG
jgi:hypothetical protein